MAGTNSLSMTSGLARALRRACLVIGGGILAAGLMAAGPSPVALAEEQDKSTQVTRDKMLNDNVDGYAAKLREKGGTFKEWMKLVQYYGVLGKTDKALQALALGKEDLKDDPRAVRRLDRFAKMVGLTP